MKTVKEMTGLEFPKYEVHVGSTEIDDLSAYVTREQWYDVLHRQEQIIMNLQSYVNGRIRDKEKNNG